jgi:N-acetylglucosaminyl-diphospho-decaprenol L-rhamnosyltransferase
VNAPPSLDVVIVAYRCRDLLRICLGSVFEHSPRRAMRVFVVDNASGDGTPAMVRETFPAVELLVNSSNRGFSAANNVAIRAGDGDYVLALNPDTELTAGALERLCALMDARPEVGICGPALVQADGSPDHAARRSFPTPLSALGHFSGIGRRRRSGALAAYRAPEVDSGPVDAVNGAFMLIRRLALDQVGLFDEGYWMYMEDLDLCYRFAEAGWTTWYEPSVRVGHLKAGTSGKHRSLRLNHAFHRGMARFYRAHYAADNNPLLNLAVYAGIALKLAASALRSAAARALARVTSAPGS